MSSKMFKTLFAGAVAAGALLLSGTSAQAATTHRPCDGPGFGDRGFFGDRIGHNFGDRFGDRFGFGDDGFGFFGDDFGFRHHRDHQRPTVIVVTVVNKNKTKAHHHPKPAGATTTGSSAGAGYTKPAAVPASTGGYRKS